MALMQTESVHKRNICESVLARLTLKMNLRFVETLAAICRTTQRSIREDLALQKEFYYYYYYYYYYYTIRMSPVTGISSWYFS